MRPKKVAASIYANTLGVILMLFLKMSLILYKINSSNKITIIVYFLFQEHVDEDKFLYIAYSDESVYGSNEIQT